jgi:hypothetical protein
LLRSLLGYQQQGFENDMTTRTFDADNAFRDKALNTNAYLQTLGLGTPGDPNGGGPGDAAVNWGQQFEQQSGRPPTVEDFLQRDIDAFVRNNGSPPNEWQQKLLRKQAEGAFQSYNHLKGQQRPAGGP